MTSVPKQPVWQVSKKLRSQARSLRRNSTDAEQLIWRALRAHRLGNVSFRRQTPIGPYVVDFVCHAANLIIELDGGQHYEKEQMQRDARRDAFLASKGYRVLRFNNYDVMKNKIGVLETIVAALEEPRSLTFSRKGGGNARATVRRDAAAPSLTLPRKRGREPGRAAGKTS